VPAPAGADWLVLRDGGRVESAGPWEVKGRLVVFKLADGSLASLRLAEVDLAASDEATAAAIREREKAVAAPAPAVKRPSVLILTDENIPKAATAGAEPGAGGEAKATAESVAEQPVAVVS